MSRKKSSQNKPKPTKVEKSSSAQGVSPRTQRKRFIGRPAKPLRARRSKTKTPQATPLEPTHEFPSRASSPSTTAHGPQKVPAKRAATRKDTLQSPSVKQPITPRTEGTVPSPWPHPPTDLGVVFPFPVGTSLTGFPQQGRGVGTEEEESRFQLPHGYGDNRIVLMIKDPWWLYAYWEIQPGVERSARRGLLPQEVIGLQTVLRVYEVIDPSTRTTAFGRGLAQDSAPRAIEKVPCFAVAKPRLRRGEPQDCPVGLHAVPASAATQALRQAYDIPISGMALSWYIHTNAPGKSFLVEIGLKTMQGKFIAMARSNQVTTPPFGPSDVVDEGWRLTDEEFWKLWGLSSGMDQGPSSAEHRKLLEGHVTSWMANSSLGIFSPGMFSPSKIRQPKNRAFWLWVKTELIVYGATDPKAKVILQGQSITLRPDGSFSVRMALPDGIQDIPVEGTSSDGKETRHVDIVVTQKTTSQGHSTSSVSTPQRDPAIDTHGL